MRNLLRSVLGFLAGDLAVDKGFKKTFRFHLLFAILDASAAGILSNVGIMAAKGLNAEDWQLGIRLTLSSVGMFATLPLGYWMATRAKSPFVFFPGMAFAFCSFLAAMTSEPLLFLLLIGLGSIFEVGLRPALTAVIREQYPATHRGAVTGFIRKWSSMVFMLVILLSGATLSQWADQVKLVISIQLVCAGLLSVFSFLAFRQMGLNAPVNQPPAPENEPDKSEIAGNMLLNPVRIIQHDKRFRRYLLSSFLFGLSGMIYAPYIVSYLVHDLSMDYFPAALYLHVIPSLGAFLFTGWIGRQIDNNNPWGVWGWTRLGWGLDPLLLVLASPMGIVVPCAAWTLPVSARFIRGASMGGSWILWWRVGINQFAEPGADTTRYMGIFVFMNGLLRLLGPIIGAWLVLTSSRQTILLIGGMGVLASAVHAVFEYRRERLEKKYSSMACFERSKVEASPHVSDRQTKK